MILCAAVILPFLWPRSDATQKSDEANPRWFMVDVKFISRTANFVPYPLLRDIAGGNVVASAGLVYIGEEGMKAIKGKFMRYDGAGAGSDRTMLSYRHDFSAARTSKCTASRKGWME